MNKNSDLSIGILSHTHCDFLEGLVRGRERKRILAANPECAYCAGRNAATEIDHFPPRQMFPKRIRPKGLETPTCSACNRGSRKAESLASLIACIHFDRLTEGDLQHFIEISTHVGNNYPDMGKSLLSTARQKREAARLGDKFDTVFSAFDLRGPEVSRALSEFGAKAGLSLHWNLIGKPLAANGQVVVLMFTNQQALDGQVPQHLFELLPDGRPLAQGRMTSEGRFEYASRQTDDGDSTAHWVSLGQAVLYNIFVGEDLSIGEIPEDNVFSPGCFSRA